MAKKVRDYLREEKEVHAMPPIELIEQERASYVKEMQDYLQKLKSMNKQDAQMKSFENLVQSEIICEDGSFTEQYAYTKSRQKKSQYMKKLVLWRRRMFSCVL